MDRGPHDVADSTDWLNTPLSAFAPLETALRCQVCKDFFQTPMITSCSHTFCSLCIRRYLGDEGRCPTCRAPDQASKLRRNWTTEETVEAFKAARDKALQLARRDDHDITGASKGKGRKRKADDAGLDANGSIASRTRRSERRSAQSSEVASSQDTDVIDLEEGVDGCDKQEVPEDGLVACPMCGQRMKEEAVFAHLDHCNEEQVRPKTSDPLRQGLPKPQQARKTSTPPPAHLPQLNFSLLNDKALRKKFQDLGIPGWGSRQLLQRRHTEWINLWNANCDSSRPRTKRELLADLDTWERTQGGNTPNNNNPTVAATVMQKDFDAKGWASTNKDQFEELIANARRKRASPAISTDTNGAKADDRTPHAPEEEKQASKPDMPALNTVIPHDTDMMAIDTPTTSTPLSASTSSVLPSLQPASAAPAPTPPSLVHQSSSGSNPRPYENNEEALQSIRRKVEAANRDSPRRSSLGHNPSIPHIPSFNHASAVNHSSPTAQTKPSSIPANQQPASPTVHRIHQNPPPAGPSEPQPSPLLPPPQTAPSSSSRTSSLGAQATLEREPSQEDRAFDAMRDDALPPSIGTGAAPNPALDRTWSPSFTKKMPMFQVPEDPVEDVDSGEAVH